MQRGLGDAGLGGDLPERPALLFQQPGLNGLRTITSEVVETARESLVIGTL